MGNAIQEVRVDALVRRVWVSNCSEDRHSLSVPPEPLSPPLERSQCCWGLGLWAYMVKFKWLLVLLIPWLESSSFIHYQLVVFFQFLKFIAIDSLFSFVFGVYTVKIKSLTVVLVRF